MFNGTLNTVSSQVKLFILSAALCFFGCISSATAENLVFVDSDKPPPGFEKSNVSQRLRVSVFFMNQYIGLYYIHLSQGRLKFDSPELVLSKLVGVRNQSLLLQHLKQALPLIVASSNLKNKPVYIVYDSEKETIQLIVSKTCFIKPSPIRSLQYLPKPTVSWSYINKFGMAGAMSSQANLNQIYDLIQAYYNLYSNNRLTYGDTSLIGNVSQNNAINNGQGLQIQNLYLQRIDRKKIYMGGYIVNPISPFIQTQTFAGIGLQTTLATLKNPQDTSATPLVVFIPEAS